MPHRRFTDSKGTAWEVWDVEASHAERRQAEPDPRASKRGPDRRRTADRTRIRLHGKLSSGWLCFESKHDKRRLAPAPEAWGDLDEAGLERLLQCSKSVGRSRRLIE
jgi:hypothetical protein